MLRLRMYGNVFADQGAGPVIKGDVAADAGAFQSDFAAVSQCPVDVVVAGDEGGVFPAFPAVDNLLGKPQVLHGGGGVILLDDILFRDAF